MSILIHELGNVTVVDINGKRYANMNDVTCSIDDMSLLNKLSIDDKNAIEHATRRGVTLFKVDAMEPNLAMQVAECHGHHFELEKIVAESKDSYLIYKYIDGVKHTPALLDALIGTRELKYFVRYCRNHGLHKVMEAMIIQSYDPPIMREYYEQVAPLPQLQKMLGMSQSELAIRAFFDGARATIGRYSTIKNDKKITLRFRSNQIAWRYFNDENLFFDLSKLRGKPSCDMDDSLDLINNLLNKIDAPVYVQKTTQVIKAVSHADYENSEVIAGNLLELAETLERMKLN